ncbi:copper amine oxidase N-terminal domain-containing protein [Paenibacillus sp. MMS20-IR301]|uniref:copper amine oxidase N-terminal domain-containing protein n=1 Tax=Paenibacillus sp. MMS20-IR301 TaxID=2895946 RepID=UPI0028ED4E59|nr:copper amine oxidase N-terminal domain-containing protein [Paenibacillus sp. MMS20-IR301]WNS41803.1 copper amine oxidase N-terminal domain-containing protein [Paenibacillus sp. MMS20-IR301]
MKNNLKVGVIAWLTASLLITGSALTTAGTVSAAVKPIEIVMNNAFVDTDIAPYITNGTTMVPLQVAQKIPGISVQWNNQSKTVTIIRGSETITLVAGQKTAKVGNKEVKLEAASNLKQGRVMVPLRFIAESTQSYVLWNAKQRIVFVAKASEELKDQFNSTILSEARTAALKYPVVSSLKSFDVVNESQGQMYYFPEGRADQFFLSGGNGISYYEITGDYCLQKWSATFNSVKASSGLFFFPQKITNQDGTIPKLTDRVVFYNFMGPIGAASYGFIETSGEIITLGQKGMKLGEIFEIPEETK